MKKVIATGLLFVFLFNTIGYKIFFYYLERMADVRIESKISKLSDTDQELITVKIPIKLPYQVDWQDYERTDGEVAVNGKIYKYVKRKVQRDTLILLCINYKEKSTIQKNSNDYFKKVNDLTADANKKPVFKQVKNDYFQNSVMGSVILYASCLNTYYSSKEIAYPSGFIRKIKMPPKQKLAST